MDELNETLDHCDEATSMLSPQRSGLRPWKPGQSGNPSGKRGFERKLVRSIALAFTPEMLVVMRTIAEDTRAPKLARAVAGAAVLEAAR